ncbi:BrnA antitoxin family protein [Blastomonas sp.]|uniref:BrnA antitoxin family protein n=1 Tax=Blastomonas sp. TaxID=1909299 RepID=UPI0026029C6E|nr:BrnA antitoxin family protein [Blastomonas sp.]MDM7957717.1 BrnA antitoxin family protein [Blastomonas sp.]
MSQNNLPPDFDENPEWTEEDFRRARPASELFDAEHVALLVRQPGRPKGSTKADAKQQVALRLDRDVIERFKAAGPGWQTRMNDALRRAAGL